MTRHVPPGRQPARGLHYGVPMTDRLRFPTFAETHVCISGLRQLPEARAAWERLAEQSNRLDKHTDLHQLLRVIERAESATSPPAR
jgi:hypothetical protein